MVFSLEKENMELQQKLSATESRIESAKNAVRYRYSSAVANISEAIGPALTFSGCIGFTTFVVLLLFKLFGVI